MVRAHYSRSAYNQCRVLRLVSGHSGTDIMNERRKINITQNQRDDILKGIALLLDGMVDEKRENTVEDKCRMLTVRECSQMVEGLSEHTIRQLIKRGELSAIRTGRGQNGKMLVPEKALIEYINRN